MKGKIVHVKDQYTVVTNLGSANNHIREGMRFKIIKLGEKIIDPDTNEELGVLEIPCGKVEVIHIQDNMSIMRSYEMIRSNDKREIKKHSYDPFDRGILTSLLQKQGEIIETIIPGEEHRKPLSNVSIGDQVIKI